MKMIKNDVDRVFRVLSSFLGGLTDLGSDLLIFRENFIFVVSSVSILRVPFLVDFECVVKGKTLCDIVLKSQGENISFKVDDNRLVVSIDDSLKAKVALTKLDLQQSLFDIVSESKDWQKPPPNFLQGVDLCSFSISHDITSGFLYCLFVDEDRLVSSDNYRISIFDLEGEFDKPFLISRDNVLKILKLENLNGYCFVADSSWVVFKSDDGFEFYVRVVKEEYPDVSSFFEFEGKWLKLPDGLKKVVGLSLVPFSNSDLFDSFVQISVKDGNFTCRSTGDEVEILFVEPVKSPKEFSFLINPLFLGKVLEFTSRMFLGEGKARFSVDNFEHLILLSR